MSRPTIHARRALLATLLAASWSSFVLAAESGVPQASASPPLPFRAVRGPSDRFTASSLTMNYDRDLALFLNARPRSIDLAFLDRYGHAPPPVSVWEDSTAKALFDRSQGTDVAEVAPGEKDALTPATAGVRMGIPSAVAATGAILGGIGLLIKILLIGI